MLVKVEVYNDGEAWCARGIGQDIFTQGQTVDELYENIREAVIIVITDGDSHPVHLYIETGGFAYVGECTVAIILVQPESRTLPLVPGPVHAIHQQDVLPTVGVIVEKSAAGAQRFWKQLSAVCATVVLELNAGSTGNVRKTKRKRSGSRV